MVDEADFEFELVIVRWPDGFRQELEQTLTGLDVDIVETSAFTGKDVLEVLGKLTEPVLEGLAKVFSTIKNEGKEIEIASGKGGEDRISLKGFDAKDLRSMKRDLKDMLREMKADG